MPAEVILTVLKASCCAHRLLLFLGVELARRSTRSRGFALLRPGDTKFFMKSLRQFLGRPGWTVIHAEMEDFESEPSGGLSRSDRTSRRRRLRHDGGQDQNPHPPICEAPRHVVPQPVRMPVCRHHGRSRRRGSRGPGCRSELTSRQLDGVTRRFNMLKF